MLLKVRFIVIMMSKPLITVIIPVYNVEKYINRCVESVAAQTYEHLEIILVDDGSTDNSPELCDLWADKDSRVRVIHKLNGGLSDARNCGLDICKGEYITFVDSDDYIEKNMLEFLLFRLKQEKSDLALCNYLCVADNSEYIDKNENCLPVKDELISGAEAQKKLFGYMHWHYVIACSKLYKRALFENFRYPFGKLHEDLFTTHLIFEKCSRVSCVHEPLYYYYQNEKSITHTYNIHRLDALDAYISRFEFFYRKHDYYCAAMSTQFMIEKITAAVENLDMKDKTIKKKICYYKSAYNKQFRKIFLKKTGKINRARMLLFYQGMGLYRMALNIKYKLIH